MCLGIVFKILFSIHLFHFPFILPFSIFSISFTIPLSIFSPQSPKHFQCNLHKKKCTLLASPLCPNPPGKSNNSISSIIQTSLPGFEKCKILGKGIYTPPKQPPPKHPSQNCHFPNGTVFWARRPMGNITRKPGQKWHSLRGHSLLFSLLIRHEMLPSFTESSSSSTEDLNDLLKVVTEAFGGNWADTRNSVLNGLMIL